MAKKKVEKPKREFTKHQRSHWQQQRQRQRRFLFIGIGILAAIGGILGSGWYTNEYQPLRETVIRVNNTEFSMQYYIDMIELDYMYGVGGDVVTFIEQNELVRHGAEDLGITASDSEVDEELNSYDPPLGKEYRDVARSNVLIEKLLSEHFEQEVPLSAEQRHVMAMFLESENQAAEARARLENGEDFGELAGELSLEALSKASGGDFGWHPRGILTEVMATSVPEDYAFSAEVGILSEPVYDEAQPKEVSYWLVKVLERDGEEEEEEAHVQAMLLGSEQEAEEVIAQLEGGADFGELAEELSLDEDTREEGGDLGWLKRIDVASHLEDFAFNSELGELSEPIREDRFQTQGGYWLIKVLDKDDNREIAELDRDLLKAKAMDEWVTSLWDDPENEVEDYLDGEKRLWATVKASQNVNR